MRIKNDRQAHFVLTAQVNREKSRAVSEKSGVEKWTCYDKIAQLLGKKKV